MSINVNENQQMSINVNKYQLISIDIDGCQQILTEANGHQSMSADIMRDLQKYDWLKQFNGFLINKAIVRLI